MASSGLVRPLLEQLDRFSRAVDRQGGAHDEHSRARRARLARSLGLRGGARSRTASPKGFGANHNQAFERCAHAVVPGAEPGHPLRQRRAGATARAGRGRRRPADAAHPGARQGRAGAAPGDDHAAGDPRRGAGRATCGRRCRRGFRGCSCCFAARSTGRSAASTSASSCTAKTSTSAPGRGWRGGSCRWAKTCSARHDAQRESHRSTQHLYWHVTSLLKVWVSPHVLALPRLAG